MDKRIHECVKEFYANVKDEYYPFEREAIFKTKGSPGINESSTTIPTK
jgi:hypothetical protein